MISVHKVIFPGIAAGCLFLVFVASLIAVPNVALASNSSPAVSAAASIQSSLPVVRTPTAFLPVVRQPSSSKPAAQQPAVQAPEADQPAAKQPAAGQSHSSAAENCSIGSGFSDNIRQWCSLIEQYAGQYGLDPNLIASVMLQESGGNPQAYSKNGAVGLLQVMPRDGPAASFMCVNGPCFSSRPSTDQLYDPEFNISYGVQMLAGLIHKNGGDVREALRSYGPMNMGYRYADIILSIMNRNQ